MSEIHTDIWQFQAQLSRQLLRWSGLSIGAGAVIAATSGRFRRGFGTQAIGWGLVDAAIAWVGLHLARTKAAALEAHAPRMQQEAEDALQRVLWINTGLDVAYVAGGIALTATKEREDQFRRGTGWGIVVQGGFLLAFDLLHALHLGRRRS